MGRRTRGREGKAGREEGNHFKGDKRRDKWKGRRERGETGQERNIDDILEGGRRERDMEIKYGRKTGTEELKLEKRIKRVGSALSPES
jgi:hypothetical protein